ncbi:MAG: ADP-forming succinate--CoA ligase subunit beta [Spirochaetes bacterium]|nr:MAG: ADP-forming succinate--CoA ligase subunit beta [Spirochaetota bacterium]
MKLFEYQARGLLRAHGIPVPRDELTRDPDTAAAITERMGGTSVIKAQVLAGGRGKAGGVKLVRSPEEARAQAARILSMEIEGMRVEKVLVSEAADIAHEYYLGIVVNRNARRAEIVFSAAGGIDIEEVARTSTDRIARIPIDPFGGIDEAAVRAGLGPSFPGEGLLDDAVSIVRKLYALFTEKDCSLVEVNPLVRTGGGELLAVDAKIVIDDNALAKHPELVSLRNREEYGDDELDAQAAGLSLVGLDGSIGCMVNGAGLAMATMDLIKHFGERPANFLDVGGSSNPQKVVDALGILLRNRNIKAILMNIFGGITRCDDIAKGVILAREKIEIPVPFVIRLIGTNEELGRAMLVDAGFHAYNDLSEAVQRVIEAARTGR